MATATSISQPDLAAVKRRQQTWASGDYAAVGARIVAMAERLVDAADLWAGQRVLDFATGSATPPWRPPAAAARSPASTTSPSCWNVGGHGRAQGPSVAMASEYVEAVAVRT